MKKEHYFITTPIYYVNDTPHIGHAYCTIAADTLARFKRFCGYEVIFSTGVDENSQKTVQAAEREKADINVFIDSMADIWKSTWEKLGITFDRFIRTTSEEHRKTVIKLLDRIYNNKDIYKKKYRGQYCTGCEKFITDSDLEDGLCIYHKTKPDRIEEENYFFALSKHGDALLKLLGDGQFALPEARKNEMEEFVKKGLEDISITRQSMKWGIKFPFDERQVIYVWFDALINYLTALEYYKDESLLEKYWENSHHLVGKDIFRFHSLMWPAMLISAGLKPPKQVFGHGFFTVNGEKMSKSLGNVIDPVKMSEKYGIDTLRYYLLREIPFGKDSDFSVKHLEERYRSDLADDFGNLINRLLVMVEKYAEGKVPEADRGEQSAEIRAKVTGMIEKIGKGYDNFAFSFLLEEIWACIRELNRYIDLSKPWQLEKEGRRKKLHSVLYDTLESVRLISSAIYPVMPGIAGAIYRMLGYDKRIEEENFNKIKVWGALKSGTKIRHIEPLFPKKEEKMDAAGEAKTESKVDIQDFRKLEFKIGEVKEAVKVENTDKLLKLTVDIGSETRTIVAGIAACYKPEELIGRKAVIVCNLKPAKIRGVESNGMLLAGSSGDVISVVSPDKPLAPGSIVK